MLRDVAAQIAQVLAALLLARLLQGFILRYEERAQRAQGPSLLQPYRDLRKLFRKPLVVPMLAADGSFHATGSYAGSQHELMRHNPWLYGVGVVLAGMSLAAMPFEAAVFRGPTHMVQWVAAKLSPLQSGNMNIYLGLVGLLLVLILAVALV